MRAEGFTSKNTISFHYDRFINCAVEATSIQRHNVRASDLDSNKMEIKSSDEQTQTDNEIIEQKTKATQCELIHMCCHNTLI